jgi:hypothetical protein
MATFLSERSLGKDDKQRAIEIEGIVIQRCFQLLTSLLRLAVTRDNGCYSSVALERNLPKVLEVAEVVAKARKMGDNT